MTPDRSSGTSVPGACNASPCVIPRGDPGDAGASSILSSTAMTMSCGRVSLAPALPAASSPPPRQDKAQESRPGEAVAPYTSGQSAVDMQEENAVLRSMLASQNTVLSSRITELSSRMDSILARLDTVTSGPPQGAQLCQVCSVKLVCDTLFADIVEEPRSGPLHRDDISSRNHRKKRPQCMVM